MAHMYAAFFKNISHEMISYNMKLTVMRCKRLLNIWIVLKQALKWYGFYSDIC